MPSHLKVAWRAVLLLLIALATLPVRAQPPSSPPATDASPPAPATEDQQAEAELTGERLVEIPVPLLERSPFDRITLDQANGNVVIETVLLDLPERRVPDPLPDSGKLILRRLSEPSIPYELEWSAIEKIELYEHMLLAEAERLSAAGEFAEAFEYLAFLTTNYPQLPHLEAALQSHLWKEASAAYAAGRRQEAWPALVALYLRNPEFPRLAAAVEAVSDDMIAAQLEAKDYSAARATLAVLEQTFPKLPLDNIARWRARFEADATEQMEKARVAFAAERFSEARAAITRARSILPTVPGGEELWKQIQGSAPEIRVGVAQSADPPEPGTTPTWASARVADLVDPKLVEMVDFGAEGGEYASQWGELSTSDDGLETMLRVSPAALANGLYPDRIALELVHMGMEGAAGGHADYAALVDAVRIARGQDVIVQWRRLHVRPEALLQAPLRAIVTAEQGLGLWFVPVEGDHAANEQPFERTGPPDSSDGAPRFVVEVEFADDEAALAALTRGDIDVLDRVPPWHLARMEQTPDVVVAQYRLPTVHVLVPNRESPLLETREFRRAICYGIDAESIVRDILLAGESRQGFRTISGPFPAGNSLSDPVGYAYNADLQPRPYEPRLAAILAGVARQMVAKREADAKKQAAAAAGTNGDGDEPVAGDEAPTASDSTEPPADSNPDAPPAPEPLALAHSTDPMARLACQSIKTQLDAIGIPVKLAEFAGGSPPDDLEYDLLYAELAVWEPVVEARRLLGPNGLAGRPGPLMVMALDRLARSENWNQAREQLHEIHRIAHYDLPLLPLWQTVNHFAYRQSVQAVGENPVSLYQNLPAWQKSFE